MGLQRVGGGYFGRQGIDRDLNLDPAPAILTARKLTSDDSTLKGSDAQAKVRGGIGEQEPR